jgi:hypothetical protein
MPTATADRGLSAWLPMPYTGGAKKLSRAEWDEYRARRARHLQQNPAFASGWRRPAPRTAEDVWQKFARNLGAKLEALLPKLDLSPDERDEANLTAKQAFTVALDAAVLAGERGAMLTQNGLFDALAARWSDHYRMAREHGPAAISYDMKVETVRAAWRDLVRNGVRFETLYSLIRRGHPDLYTTTRVPMRGYTVEIDLGSPTWTEFVRIIDVDPVYGRSRKQQRLLLANEEPQLVPAAHAPDREEDEEGNQREKVAGEWAYNRVEVGPRSVELIRRLEAARLWVHAPTLIEGVSRLEQQRDELDVLLWDEFGVDVTKSPAKPRARKKTKGRRPKARSARQWAMAHVRQCVIPTLKGLVEEYDEVNGQFLQLRDVRVRLIDSANGAIEGHVQLKSRFYKLVNRRYQAANFWPVEVTGKDIQTVVLEEGTQSRLLKTSSRRGRWFSAESKFEKLGWEWEGAEEWGDDWAGDRRPLVGVDVSTSQLQILAVFLGLDEFETETTRQSFKKTLATEAYHRDRDPKDNRRLVKKGRVTRRGAGHKGDPFVWAWVAKKKKKKKRAKPRD